MIKVEVSSSIVPCAHAELHTIRLPHAAGIDLCERGISALIIEVDRADEKSFSESRDATRIDPFQAFQERDDCGGWR